MTIIFIIVLFSIIHCRFIYTASDVDTGIELRYTKIKSIFTQIDKLSTEGSIHIFVDDKLIVQRDHNESGDAQFNPLIFHTNRCDVIIAIGLALANGHPGISKHILTGAYHTLDLLRNLNLDNPVNKYVENEESMITFDFEIAREFRNQIAVDHLPLEEAFEIEINGKKRHYREERNGPIFMDGRFSDEIIALGIALARSTTGVTDDMLVGACTFLDDMDARAVSTHNYSHNLEEQKYEWESVAKSIFLPENAVRPFRMDCSFK